MKNQAAFVDQSGRVWKSRQAYEEYREERREWTREALKDLF